MKIVSPSGTHFAGEVLHASFPGALGEFAVFPSHAPLISGLKKGKIRYATAEGDASFDIESGFVEVDNDSVTVCVEK